MNPLETTLNTEDELVETGVSKFRFLLYGTMADRTDVAEADHHVMTSEQKTKPCGVLTRPLERHVDP